MVSNRDSVVVEKSVRRRRGSVDGSYPSGWRKPLQGPGTPCLGARPVISVSLGAGALAAAPDPDTTVALEVESRRRGAGAIDHRVILTAENTGKRHAHLSDGELHLKDGAWSMTLGGDELLAAVGAGLVQPGKRRRFVFPINMPSAPETAVARFQLR